MVTYLRIMMEVSSIFLIISGTDENLVKKKELWKYVKNSDSKLYKELKDTAYLAIQLIFQAKSAEEYLRPGYKVMNKLIGFN